MLSQGFYLPLSFVVMAARQSNDAMLKALLIAFWTLPATLQSPIMKNLSAAP